MNPGVESLPLRDIHLPGSVSWWPPALGWWIVLGVLLLLVVSVLLMRYAKKRNQFARIALSAFDSMVEEYEHHGDSQKLLEDLSALMRRISVNTSKTQNSAGLTGEAWLRFLDEYAAKSSATKVSARFNSPLGRWLITAPYQKQISPGQQDVQQLLILCREWISAQLLILCREWISAVSRRSHTAVTAGVH